MSLENENNNPVMDHEAASTLNALQGLVSQDRHNEMAQELIGDQAPAPEAEPVPLVDTPLSADQIASQATGVVNPEPTPAVAPENQQPVDVENEIENQDPSNDLSLDSPLLGGKFALGKEEESQPLFEGVDQVDTYVKENLGYETFGELVNNVNELKNVQSSYQELQNNYKTVSEQINSLPMGVQAAIQASLNGDDWKAAIKTSIDSALDYNKDISNYSEKDLINAYFPGKMSAEDHENTVEGAMDYDPTKATLKEVLLNQAKEKFSNEKQSIRTSIAEKQQETQRYQESFVKSVDQSVGSIKEYFPHASNEYIDSVKNEIVSGKLSSLFYDDNGLPLPDAAARYAMAKDGHKLLQQAINMATQAATTKANKEFVARTPERVKHNTSTTHGNNPEGELSDDFQNYRSNLLAGLGNKSVFNQ